MVMLHLYRQQVISFHCDNDFLQSATLQTVNDQCMMWFISVMSHNDFFPLFFYLHKGSTAYPICHCERVSVCGRLSSVFCWWPQMPVPSSVTSRGSQRKPSPPSYASSLSTRPWRNFSTWVNTFPLTRTTTWTN